MGGAVLCAWQRLPAFARKFPEAKVWTVPDLWSFPLDLPAKLLGIDRYGDLLDTAPKVDFGA